MTSDHPPAGSSELHAEFLRLFLNAQPDIYRYVCALLPRPQDAADVVQETALALWENFERYDRDRPFVPWALRFALNKVRQHAQKIGRFPLLLQDETLLEMLAVEQQAARPEIDRREENLRHCLRKLPADAAEMLEQYYWHRRPVEEVAQNGGVSIEAAYKRLQRIRLQLLGCITRLTAQENAEA